MLPPTPDEIRAIWQARAEKAEADLAVAQDVAYYKRFKVAEAERDEAKLAYCTLAAAAMEAADASRKEIARLRSLLDTVATELIAVEPEFAGYVLTIRDRAGE